jgi:chromosome partitioning protein
MLGLKQLLRTVAKVHAKLNPRIQILGFLLTMYDRREKITSDVEDIMRTKFGKEVFSTIIRVNTRQKMAPAEGKTIFEFEQSAHGKGSADYIVLAEEVLGRLLARREEGLTTQREVGYGAG